MSLLPADFTRLPSSTDTVMHLLIGRRGYIFNTPYRWGRPVENDWLDIGEPWSTHWTSVVLDRDRGNPLNLDSHLFFVDERPELMPYDIVALPAEEDFPARGYWRVPRLGLSYYFVAEVIVRDTDEHCECWFELTDEEEERLWDRYMYNDMVANPSRYE